MKIGRLSALAIGLALSTTLSGAVLAADIEAPAVHDWTGFYVGGHVGYGWIDLEGKYTGVPGAGEDFIDDGGGDFDLDDDGFVGGVQFGYNHQIDNIVLGVEADFSFTNLNDEKTNEQGELVSFDTDYIASLRARAGYAFDDILLFASAGAAWTNTNFYVNDHTDDTSWNEKGHKRLSDVGFVFGGGAAYAIDENWSITAEGLYYIFDQDEDTTDLTHDTEAGDFIKLDDLLVARVGLNFHW